MERRLKLLVINLAVIFLNGCIGGNTGGSGGTAATTTSQFVNLLDGQSLSTVSPVVEAGSSRSNFKGSMANAGISTASGENVAAENGSFIFNYTVFDFKNFGLVGNKLSLAYNSSTKVWDVGMPRVDIRSSPKLLVVNGAQYIIDGNSPTGLKYMADKSNRFDSWNGKKLSDVCSNPNAPASYFYSYIEPNQRMYFGQNGQLVAVTDNHKNCNVYKYDSNGRIATIIDMHNQSFTFKHLSSGIQIWSPTDKLADIHYSSANVVDAITDALGRVTRFGYTNGLLSNIRYFNGLVTNISYKSLPYSSGGSTLSLRVVDTVTHKGSGGVLDATSYYYGEGTGNHNFMGYGAYSANGDNDSMMERQVSDYTYDVKVIKKGRSGNRVTQTFYNFLHLPIKIVTQNGDGSYTIENKYDTEYGYGQSRKAYYTNPVQVSVNVNGKPMKNTVNQYDANYGVLLSSSEYSNSGGGLKLKLSSTNTPDTALPWLIKTATSKDAIAGHTMVVNKSYDANGEVLSSTASYDGATYSNEAYTYYASGRVKTYTHNGATSSYAYTVGNGQLVASQTNPVGRVISSTNSLIITGNPVLAMSIGKSTSSYQVDLLGRVTSQKDALGAVITYSYGTSQNSVTAPSGYQVIQTVDELGRVTGIADNVGGKKIATIHYDQFGDKDWERDDLLNLTTSYSHDGWGRVTSTVNPDGSTTEQIYDDNNNTVTSKQNGARVGFQQLDGDGNVLEETSYARSGGHSIGKSTKYDGFGRVFSEVTKQDGGVYATSQYTLDGNGNVLTSSYTGSDGSSKTVTTSYDPVCGLALGSSSTVVSGGKASSHSSVSYSYNKACDMVSSTDQQGASTSYNYDDNGLVSSAAGADKTVSYKYDLNGQLLHTTTTSATGSTNVDSTYDLMGNVTTNTIDGKTYTYSYKDYGTKLDSITNPDGNVIKYSYYGNDLLQSINDNKYLQRQFAYDNLGSVTNISEHGHNFTYEYGTQNGMPHVLNKVTLSGGNTAISTRYDSYDGWMHPSQITTSYGSNSMVTRNDIDGFGKLRNYSLQASNPSWQQTISYNYNNLGQLLSSSDSKYGTERFSYDANGNLTEHTTFNNDKHTLQHNAIDQLSYYDGAKLEYDVSGNLLKDEIRSTYSYDNRGNLQQVTLADGKKVRYSYYANDLLASRTVTQASGIMSANNGFYYADDGSLTWVSDNGHNYYVLSSVSGFVESNGVNNRYPLISNRSMRTLVDSKGNPESSISSYGSYGERLSGNNDNITEAFAYNHKQYTDRLTGLIYAHARWYSPKRKQFISRDSWTLANRYQYGDGDPIGNSDPTGHASVSDWIGVGAGIVGSTVATIAAGAATAATAGAASPSWGGVAALWVSAVSAVGASAADGVRIGAQDNGNEQLAQAMSYTSMGLGALSTVSGIAGGKMIANAAKVAKTATAVAECPGGACTPNSGLCFTADTRVLMAKESSSVVRTRKAAKEITKAIADIKVGDIVETGKDPQ